MFKRRTNHLTDEQLSLLLDGQLNERERRAAEEHLRACATCQDAYEGLRQTVALLRAAPRVSVPRAFTLTEADVGRRPARGTAPVWTRWATALVGLMLVLVLGVDVLTGTLRLGAPPAREAKVVAQLEQVPLPAQVESVAETPVALTRVVTKEVAKKGIEPTLSARPAIPLEATAEVASEIQALTQPSPEARVSRPTPEPRPSPSVLTPLPSPAGETEATSVMWFARPWLRYVEVALALLFITLLLVSRIIRT